MKRFKIYDLRFTIFLLFFLLFLNHESYFINHVYAAESTPSSEIRTKLEELKREIASKAAKLKGEVNRKLQNKAYVGNVKSKSSTSLTLAQTTGAKLVSINQDTIFESEVKQKQKFSQKTLETEDYIAALGDIDDTGVLTAKKIILLPTPKLSTKTYMWGKVVSKDLKLATLLDRNQKNIAVSFSLDTDFKVGDFIIAIGTKNKNDIFEAEFVYVIPKGGILKPKKMATPSAQTATSSTKTSTTPTKSKP